MAARSRWMPHASVAQILELAGDRVPGAVLLRGARIPRRRGATGARSAAWLFDRLAARGPSNTALRAARNGCF